MAHVVASTVESPERPTVESVFIGSADFRVTKTGDNSKGRAKGILAYAKALRFTHADGTAYSAKSIPLYGGKFTVDLANRTVTITAKIPGRSTVAGMTQEEIDSLNA